MTKAGRKKLGKRIQKVLNGKRLSVNFRSAFIAGSQQQFTETNIEHWNDRLRVSSRAGYGWFDIDLSAVREVWCAGELPRFRLTMNDDSTIYLDGAKEY
jgi:hypothetical protein